MRVVLFANEKFGLSGARDYAARYADSLANHQLALESDFGAGAVWRFATRIQAGAVDAVLPLARLLEPLGIGWDGNEAWGGADFIPLREARVPLADLTQDGTYYFDVHHTVDDTLDKVDPESLAQNVAAYSAVAWFAAETSVDFGQAPPHE